MKNIMLSFLLIFITLFLYPFETSAQWIQTNGPYEASVSSFAVKDSIIYAGTVGAGIYRSSNNGDSWISCNGAMSSTYSLCLAVSGKNIYAGSATGEGISLSTDNGTTWKSVNNGLPPNPWANGDNQIVTGVIDRLAASDNNVFTSMRLSPDAFYLSTDNGSSWTNANTGSISGISAIAIIGNNFFVGSSNGVYISKNNGAIWIAAGLTDSVVTSFAVIGSNLFAGTNSGVYETTDNGKNWTPADSGLPQTGIIQLSANGSSIMVKVANSGFFLTTNNGASWTALSTTGFPVDYAAPNAFSPASGDLLYGFSDWGIYRSTNFGKNWNVSNTGLGEATITNLIAIGKSAYVTTNNYVYTDSNNGLDWIPILTGMRVLTAEDSVFYATADSGVCYSTDGGESWTTPLNSGAPKGIEYTALAAAGTNIYLGGAGICGVCDQGGVYLSTNNGTSWNKKSLYNATSLAVNGHYVYSIGSGGFFISTDMGTTWGRIVLPSKGGSFPIINAIAFRGSEIFLGCMGLTNGVYWGGVLHSTDGGAQWAYIDAGLPDSAQWWVTSLTTLGPTVIAGTTVGVYVLNSNEGRWIPINSGLSQTNDHVNYLAASVCYLYAAINGAVWKRPFDQIVSAIKQSPVTIPSIFSLEQNYPNPFNPSTIISYQLPVNSKVVLKIYDLLGKEVATLVNDYKTAGNYSVSFDASKLSSGVYFYRMKAGSFVETKKLILLK